MTPHSSGCSPREGTYTTSPCWGNVAIHLCIAPHRWKRPRQTVTEHAEPCGTPKAFFQVRTAAQQNQNQWGDFLLIPFLFHFPSKLPVINVSTPERRHSNGAKWMSEQDLSNHLVKGFSNCSEEPTSSLMNQKLPSNHFLLVQSKGRFHSLPTQSPLLQPSALCSTEVP